MRRRKREGGERTDRRRFKFRCRGRYAKIQRGVIRGSGEETAKRREGEGKRDEATRWYQK